jgi:hypothetical protein
VCVTVLESKMQSDPSVTCSKVLWVVGGGGVTSVHDTSLLPDPSIVPTSTTDPIQQVLLLSDIGDAGDYDGSSALEMMPLTPFPTLSSQGAGGATGPIDLELEPSQASTETYEQDACSGPGHHRQDRREVCAASWRQGTEMAAELIGQPNLEEEDDLRRAYRALQARPALSGARPEEPLIDFEL